MGNQTKLGGSKLMKKNIKKVIKELCSRTKDIRNGSYKKKENKKED